MSRGDKNYNKVVRSVKNKSTDKKKKAIHKMVESLIKGNSEDAADHLHDYLTMKTQDIVLGEMEDEKEDDKDDSKDDDKDDDDSDDKKDDDDSDKKDDDDSDKKDDDSDDDDKKDDDK